jgi:uncharacterized protein (TIGR02598 family)
MIARLRRSGFSLVEVSLAMGILAFVGLAVLGLLGVGMTSGRFAQTDTALTAATRFAVSSLQTKDPASVAGTNFWFNADGVPLDSADNAHFQCLVGTNAPAPVAPRLIGLRLEFSHPVSVPPAARTTNVIYASTIRTN